MRCKKKYPAIDTTAKEIANGSKKELGNISDKDIYINVYQYFYIT